MNHTLASDTTISESASISSELTPHQAQKSIGIGSVRFGLQQQIVWLTVMCEANDSDQSLVKAAAQFTNYISKIQSSSFANSCLQLLNWLGITSEKFAFNIHQLPDAKMILLLVHREGG